jgi:predicted CoA-binding protein
MPHTNPPDDQLKQILKNASTIAVVGASGNADKPSYGIMQQLKGPGTR